MSIARFAYDVFSYMLPLCGFPKTAISRTDIEENIYKDKDFVKKSSLSVFPLSMYLRDDWKKMFEMRHFLTPLVHFEIIKKYLKLNLSRNIDFQRADEATKVRISLSFFSELTLFLNYKGLETHVNKLPELWSEFYLEYITESQDIEELFSSSFLMFPEATGSTKWILSFIKDLAVPYGLGDVSYPFSLYSVLSRDSKSSPLKKATNIDPTDNLSHKPDASVAKASDSKFSSLKKKSNNDETINVSYPPYVTVAVGPEVKSKNSASSLQEHSDLLSALEGNHESSNTSESSASKKGISLRVKACRKQFDSTTDVLEVNPKIDQKLSEDLGIDDFGQMNLAGESRNVKPKCKKGSKKKQTNFL